MKNAFRALIAAASMVAAGSSWGADAGRVILSAGDAVAVRGTQTVRLMLGAVVQDRDVLRTGPASNLQVRFTDETVISIRENSEIRVDEYNFTGKLDGSESMGLRLLKGGLRVVTGLVGRSNEKNFAVRTTTATIGIRGTDFGTALCQQDCRNADGSQARDGQYGRVHGQSHGTNQINVANERDQRTFGINENFYVADAKSVVEPLLTPPDFVASRLESRKQGGTGAAGGTGREQTTSGGSSQDGRSITELPPANQPLAYISTEERTASGTPEVAGALNVAPTIAGVGGLRGISGPAGRGGFFSPSDLVTNPPGAASNLAQTQTLVGFSLAANSSVDGVAASGSTASGSVIDETQPNSLNAHWGRWTSGTVSDGSGTITVNNSNQFHYLYGPMTPWDVVASKSGAFNMQLIGGTTPSNDQGQTNANVFAAPLTVNFSARTVTLGNVNLHFPGFAAASQNWTFNNPGTAPIVQSNGGAGFNLASLGQCAGTNCNSGVNGATLKASGVFMGNRGDHVGVNFQMTQNNLNHWATTSKIFSCANQGC